MEKYLRKRMSKLRLVCECIVCLVFMGCAVKNLCVTNRQFELNTESLFK